MKRSELKTGPAACMTLYLAIVPPGTRAKDADHLLECWKRNTATWAARETRRRDRRKAAS